MRSLLRSVKKRKKSRVLGEVQVVSREEYTGLDVDSKVEMIRALLPLGLMQVEELLDEEVKALAGERYARKEASLRGRRHGSNPGTLALGGQRVPVRVPRVRSVAGGEIPLRSYDELSPGGAVNELLLRRVLYGISCRNYESAAEAIPGAIGLSMAMASAGLRGDLADSVVGGFALAFKADALWVGTGIEGVDGPAGRLAATAAAVTRFRTGLEGSRDYTLGGRVSLRPSVEVGLRHDGGEAGTGAGMDVAGGLVMSDTSTGLSVDVRVRTLLVHQADGFRERGVAVSLSYNPTPPTPLGFVARVAPSWGGEAASGAEALWGRDTMAGMAHGGGGSGNRFAAELGYGLPVGSRQEVPLGVLHARRHLPLRPGSAGPGTAAARSP